MSSHSSDLPNVLLLAIDSLRADAVFGEEVATPTFDRLAHTGASFRQAVCTATTTTPSFSSMLTGCYPPRHGVRGLQGYRLSPSVTTMAEAFAQAGYRCYAEVTGPLLPETSILRGFHEARCRQAYKVPFFNWREEVMEKMQSYAEPWFMLLHIWEAHRPYRSPPDFEKRKDKAGYQAAVHATDEWLAPVFEAAGDDPLIVLTGDHGEQYPSSPLQFQMLRVARRSRRTFRLGKWLPYLDNRFAGLEIGHGFALHEELVRVPLILSGPRIPAGSRVNDQVRHIDLLPTLADLCDIPCPENIDGRSLKPFMEGAALSAEPAYMEAVGVKLGGDRIVGARTPEWKLLKAPGGKKTLHRLNPGGAPDERHNHVRDEPTVVRELLDYIVRVESEGVVAESGMTSDEEATVEQHLRDLGYL
ncbi:MAG: sulfatase [Actinomycetota bacterium]|nr:sulfatase [Actinomycetota bacterium]